VALAKLYYFCSKEKQIDCLTRAKVIKAKRLASKERNRAFKAQIAISAHLFHFKKVYKKIYLKEYYFIK